MNRINEWLENLAERKDIKMTGSKISQTARNQLRRDFADMLAEVLATALNNDLIKVARTKDGVGLAIDNEKIGFIPIEIKPVFKDTEVDILELAEEYQEHLREQAEKKAKAEREKKAKIEAQAKAKALKEKAKAIENGDDLDDLE